MELFFRHPSCRYDGVERAELQESFNPTSNPDREVPRFEWAPNNAAALRVRALDLGSSRDDLIEAEREIGGGVVPPKVEGGGGLPCPPIDPYLPWMGFSRALRALRARSQTLTFEWVGTVLQIVQPVIRVPLDAVSEAWNGNWCTALRRCAIIMILPATILCIESIVANPDSTTLVGQRRGPLSLSLCIAAIVGTVSGVFALFWCALAVALGIAVLPLVCVGDVLTKLKTMAIGHFGRPVEACRRRLDGMITRVSNNDVGVWTETEKAVFTSYSGIKIGHLAAAQGDGFYDLAILVLEMPHLVGNGDLVGRGGFGCWVPGFRLRRLWLILGSVTVVTWSPWCVSLSMMTGGIGEAAAFLESFRGLREQYYKPTGESKMAAIVRLAKAASEALNVSAHFSVMDLSLAHISKCLRCSDSSEVLDRVRVDGVEVQQTHKGINATEDRIVVFRHGLTVAPGSLAESIPETTAVGDVWSFVLAIGEKNKVLEQALQIIGALNTFFMLAYVIVPGEGQGNAIFTANIAGEVMAMLLALGWWFFHEYADLMDVLDPFHAILKWPSTAQVCAVAILVTEALCGVVGIVSFAFYSGDDTFTRTYAAVSALVLIPALIGGIGNRKTLVLGCLIAYSMEMAAEVVFLLRADAWWLTWITLATCLVESVELLVVSVLIVATFTKEPDNVVGVTTSLGKVANKRGWTESLGLPVGVGTGLVSRLGFTGSSGMVPRGLRKHDQAETGVAFAGVYKGLSARDTRYPLDGGCIAYGVSGESCSDRVFGEPAPNGAVRFTFRVIGGEMIPNV